MGRSQLLAHDVLRPERRLEEIEAVVEFALAYIAYRIVSPPKEDDENNEFECDDVATRIAGAASEVIAAMLIEPAWEGSGIHGAALLEAAGGGK